MRDKSTCARSLAENVGGLVCEGGHTCGTLRYCVSTLSLHIESTDSMIVCITDDDALENLRKRWKRKKVRKRRKQLESRKERRRSKQNERKKKKSAITEKKM